MCLIRGIKSIAVMGLQLSIIFLIDESDYFLDHERSENG